MNIILASTSPRRKAIMDSLGIDYTIVPSHYEEEHGMHVDPKILVEDFSCKKAVDVLARHPDAIVIGSDTMVVDADGKLLGKPKDRADAKQMITRLQGKESYVYSGLAVLSADKEILLHETVTVTFDPLTDNQIEAYLDDPTAAWEDKAGAYGIQPECAASKFVHITNGEYETIMGMPKARLIATLRDFGISV